MTYTLVISSYGYGHLAAHAIESALSQTRPFDEILFVDDGKGDCSHLVPLYKDRGIEFILREKNLGIIDNFNDMLKRVETEYVMFLGADNWLRSDALHLISGSINYNLYFKPDICVYDIIVTGELKQEIHAIYSHFMRPYHGNWYWSRKGGHHGSMVYRVSKAKEVGGYAHNKQSGRTDEDQNLWDKLHKVGCRAIHLEEGLLYYRRHKENFNKY
jgi:glycosyltransferase involved in cell wall biosynthesis